MTEQYEKGSSAGMIFFDRLMVRSPCYTSHAYDPACLTEVLSRQEFQDAIYLASGDLYRELEKKEFDAAQLNHQERNSVLKYYNRMSFRPTPFGAFSSFGLTPWLDQAPSAGEQPILHLLPDQQLRLLLARAQEQNGLPSALLLNPTLYLLGKAYRYSRAQPDPKGKLDFTLEEIGAGKLHRALMRLMGKGPVARESVLALICRQGGCGTVEAGEYLNFLLEVQFLYDSGQGDILEPKPHAGSNAAFHYTFPTLARIMEETQGRPVPAVARMLEEELKSANIALPRAIFYAGLERNIFTAAPDLSDRDKLSALLPVLQKLVQVHTPPALRKFTLEFKDKFEREKVPLLLALDPDAGVSYADLENAGDEIGWLGNIPFREDKKKGFQQEWTGVQSLLLKLWPGRSQPSASIVLTDQDLVSLSQPEKAVLPASIALMFCKKDAGLLIESAGGITGNTLAGRFSAFSPHVTDFCREIAAREAHANPGVIFAEICALSSEHVDNINRRAPIYDYILPLNVYPAADRKAIALSDLLLSVSGEELILESVSLGKRVIPRLPTAYNTRHTGLSLFRLLSDLQYQGFTSNLLPDLESHFPGLAFYPRLMYHDIILSPAKWHLDEAAVTSLSRKPLSLGRLHLFREAQGLPRRVSLGEGDQQLTFDLGTDSEALFFLDCLQGLKKALLREYLDLPDQSDGRVLQHVAFVSNPATAYRPLAGAATAGNSRFKRHYLPGSEWLYLKFYCTPGSANTLLQEVILPVIGTNRHLLHSWFFIRYQDSAHHLRVRLQLERSELARLLAAFEQRIEKTKSQKLVRELSGNTYHRELERYAPEVIGEVEAFFCADSDLVAEAIRELTDKKEKVYLRSFRVAAAIAEGFFPESEQAGFFWQEMSDRFLAQLGSGDRFIAELDKQYRLLRQQIGSALAEDTLTKSWESCLSMVVKKTAGWEDKPRRILAADLIHMHVNRFFPARQLHHEALLYYCGNKFRISLAARQRKANGPVYSAG